MILKYLLQHKKISRRTYRRLYKVSSKLRLLIYSRPYTRWAEHHWWEPLYHNMICHTDLIHNGNLGELESICHNTYNCNHGWREVTRFTSYASGIEYNHSVMHAEKAQQCEKCNIYKEDNDIWIKPLDL